MSSLEAKLESQNWVLNHTLLFKKLCLFLCIFVVNSSSLLHFSANHHIFQLENICNCSVKWKKSSKALIPAVKALRKKDNIYREVAAYGPQHSFKINVISLPIAFTSQQYRTSL